MPATAAHQPAPDEEPCLASVVSLASRRGPDSAVPPDPVDDGDAMLMEQATQHWRGVFTKAGLTFDSPETAKVVPVIAAELERLVGGLLVLREGRGDLPADPNAGVDLTSAVEVTGILRDLSRAMGVIQANQD